uniref:CbiQ family ECF transporter T component n=1 Tax=Bacillus altitudinis TaxID=293387 RepID=UPI002357FF5C
KVVHGLGKMKVGVDEVGVMMCMCVGFIGSLVEEREKMMKGEMGRGVDFRRGGVKDGLKGIVGLVVGVLVSGFKGGEELGTGMEGRGYGGGEGGRK